MDTVLLLTVSPCEASCVPSPPVRNPLTLFTGVRQGRAGDQQGPQQAVLQAPDSRSSTQARWALLCTRWCTGKRGSQERNRAPPETRVVHPGQSYCSCTRVCAGTAAFPWSF